MVVLRYNLFRNWGVNALRGTLERRNKYRIRSFTYSFAGPKKLEDLLKKDIIDGKTGDEITDIWYTYHEEKSNTVGLVLTGETGKKVLSRASECPLYVQPIFRDDGYFVLVSQFQGPSHFLCAYLEDYKMDPNAATPLLSISIFDDYASDKGIALVRGEVLNLGIEVNEGRKFVESLLDNYRIEEEFSSVKAFNKNPNEFRFEDYISRMRNKWKSQPSTVDV